MFAMSGNQLQVAIQQWVPTCYEHTCYTICQTELINHVWTCKWHLFIYCISWFSCNFWKTNLSSILCHTI